MVLDLKSGVPQLTIDTSIEVYGLRPIGNTILVIGDRKTTDWNLPQGNPLPSARINVEDGTKTVYPHSLNVSSLITASISAGFLYIALARNDGREEFLGVYCPSTGRKIRGEAEIHALWIAPGGHDIWCAVNNGVKVFKITPYGLNPP